MTALQRFIDQLHAIPWNIAPKWNESMRKHISARLGGNAAVLLTLANREELLRMIELLNQREDIPWVLLGKGTNLLFTDEGFPGIVLQLSGDFHKIEIGNRENCLIVGAGTPDTVLAKEARNRNLSGAEFLSTIPGTIGGAIYMNAGAHGCQIADIVQWVEWIDLEGKIHQKEGKEIGFDYRFSAFMQSRTIITRTELIFVPGNREEIIAKEKKLQRIRKETQPINQATWGSVFKNPPQQSAGKLLEDCDLKGKGFGGARISPKHANFIENTGNATFDDVQRTIKWAQQTVFDKFGVWLETEVEIIRP